MLSLYVYICMSIKQNLLHYLHSQTEWFHSHSVVFTRSIAVQLGILAGSATATAKINFKHRAYKLLRCFSH